MLNSWDHSRPSLKSGSQENPTRKTQGMNTLQKISLFFCVHDAAAGFPPPNLTRRLQGFFPLGVCLGVDVTCDVVEGEEKVVLVVKLRRKLDLHLRTRGGGA